MTRNRFVLIVATMLGAQASRLRSSIHFDALKNSSFSRAGTPAPPVVAAAALSLCLAFPGFGGERVTVAGGLGAPAFADRETSATFALPPATEKNWKLTFAPGLMTPSNRVDVAFGFDADGDSVLSHEETDAVIGYEHNGGWFILGGDGLGERWTSGVNGGATALFMSTRLSEAGELRGCTFRDDSGWPAMGRVAFAGLPPGAAFLNPARWNAARLTARGGGARAEAFQVLVTHGGTIIIVK